MNTPRFSFELVPVPVIVAALLALGSGGCDTGPTGPSGGTNRQTGLVEGVVQLDGSPVEGSAAVGLARNRELLRSTLTDERGRFAFAGVEAGSYELWVTPPELFEVTQASPGGLRVDVAPDRTSSVLVLLSPVDTTGSSPAETGTLVVSARAGEDPVEGIYVSVTRQEDGEWAGSGRTDGAGLAGFSLAAGSYEVAVIPSIRYEVNGEAAKSASVTVNETTRIDFSLTRLESLPPGQLLVYADADSLPVPGVRVYALDEGASERLDSAVTDEQGRVAFTLDEGGYWAEIEPPDGYELLPGQPNPMGTIYVQPGMTTWAGFGLARTR